MSAKPTRAIGANIPASANGSGDAEGVHGTDSARTATSAASAASAASNTGARTAASAASAASGTQAVGAEAPVRPADAALVQLELEHVLASPAFEGAQAHQRLLRHVVECTLGGEPQRLKESLIGIEVFQRPAGSFDPRSDSIVRVEARRLRQRLQQHYEDSQAHAHAGAGGIVIELPKGSYRPRFVPRHAAASAAEAGAAELVERGLYFLRQGHEDGHRKALARFQAAAQAAPGLAAAHAGVARAWVQLVATNIEPPRPGIDHALAAVRRALQLEPGHADSLVLAAQLTHRFEFDWPTSSALFERAARAAPGSAFVRHTHAFSLMVRADFDAADALLAQARALDPLHLGLRAHQGLLCLYRRDWPAAEAALRALLDMSPHNVLGMSLLAGVALLRGDAAAALPQFRAVAERHPRLSIGSAGVVQCLAALGQTAAARAELARLQAHWPDARHDDRPALGPEVRHDLLQDGRQGGYLSPYQLAMCHTRLGDDEAALDLLQRAVDERDPNALCLPVDPCFDALRSLPRGAALVARVLGRPG
jgi:tetratricopeptide (TPR) repeat protein